MLNRVPTNPFLWIAAIAVALMTLSGCRTAQDDRSATEERSFDVGLDELLQMANADQVPLTGSQPTAIPTKPSSAENRYPLSAQTRNSTATKLASFATGISNPAPQTTSTDSIAAVSVSSTDLDSRASDNQEIKPADSKQETEVRTISLSEALQLAVNNNDFVIDNANFLSPSNPLLNEPQFANSRFDIDLQKSSSQSVQAALADFETQFASGMQWGRNSIIQANNNLLNSQLLVSDNGTFYGRLDKPMHTGGAVSVIHNLNYASQDQSNYVADPRYSGYLRGEFRQPLLAGRGRTFTDIAGPLSYRSRQQKNGVALAEIGEQTAEIDFQLGLQRVQQQTEELYWDCWLAGQVYENQQIAAKNAQAIWQRIQNRSQTGLNGGGIADEAQAEENFHYRNTLAESARVDLEQATDRLKHALGFPPEDKIPLVLTDQPTQVPTVFELASSIDNGLNNRQELRKQDLQIRAIEYQLFAAQQLHRPQLDLVSGVQLNGLGDELFTPTGALPELFNTDDFGWNVGFEFSMPLGFQREKLNARYLRLLLAKAQMARRVQEQEIQHEISFTGKSVEKWNQSLASSTKRSAAAARRLAAVESEFKAGRTSLDQFLRAQDSVAQAHVEFATAQAEAAKAQLNFLFRQGLPW